jgi:sugar phosphate isomerase/epimerase
MDALGGGTIVLQPTARRKERSSGSEGIVRALRTYADLAAPFEVVLAFEFRATSSVPNLDAAGETIERVARSNLCLALSTDAWSASRADLDRLDGIEPGTLALLHLDGPIEAPPADSRQTPTRNESNTLSHICARLAAAGFRGPYCVPLPPEPGTPLERAHAAREWARHVLQAGS